MDVQHDADNQEFTASENGHPAELAYSLPAPNVIDFTHTYVDEALRGRGVGDELARTALAYARQKKWKVRTTCSFMKAFVQRHHDEYADLLA